MAYYLRDIVSEWMVENGKSEAQLARLYTIALSGLREMHLDVNGIVKIVELPINDNDTVDLPLDYVKYTRVGVATDDGHVITMGIDNSINLSPDCGREGRDVTDSTSPYYNYPYSGQFQGVNGFVGGLFAEGGAQNAFGYYRFNRETNQLWLSNVSTISNCSIILEYIADISASEDGDFIVHPYVIQAVKDYISWKYVNGDRNTGISEKQLRKREYGLSLKKAKKRYGQSTPEEWASSFRKSNTATVRF